MGRLFRGGLVAAFVTVAGHATALKETLMVPSSTPGVLLATDVYRKDDAPRPVLVIRTPYGRENHASTGADVEQNGNAVLVVQDTRGRGASGGEFDGFVSDGPDGHALLAWIDAQPWSSGRVSSWGGSALGIAQYLMAPGAPAEHVCQWVEVAASTLYQDMIYQGGVRRSEFDGWATGLGESQLVELWNAHPEPLDPFWEAVTVSSEEAATINVAAAHIGGWYDIFTQGTLETFDKYQSSGGQGARGRSKLVVGPWPHGKQNPAGELTYPASSSPASEEAPYAALANAWLVGCFADDWSLWDATPAVQIYVMGDVDDPAASGNRWRTYDAWPPPSREVRLHFAPERALRTEPPAAAEVSFVSDPNQPVPSIGGNNLTVPAGPHDQRALVESRQDSHGDVVTFGSEPFDERVEIIGRLSADVWLRTDAPDVDVVVRVTDVYPDGRSMLLVEGVQRARYRDGPSPELLAPGELVLVPVDLWSTAIALEPGHALRVIVSASATPILAVNPQNGEHFPSAAQPAEPAEITIALGGEHASSLVLPVTEGLEDAGPGAGGTSGSGGAGGGSESSDDGGCSCRLAGGERDSAWLLLAGAALLLRLRRRS